MNSIPKKVILIPLGALFFWTVALVIGFGVLGTVPSEMQYLGQFGDMFGSLNTLFSGLAMSGALYAIILQTRQIRDQADQFQAQKNHDELMLRRGKFEQLMGVIFLATQEAQEYIKEAHQLSKPGKSNEHIRNVQLHLSEAELLAALYFPTLVDDVRKLSPIELMKAFDSILSADSAEEKAGHIPKAQEAWGSFFTIRCRAIANSEAHIKIPPAEKPRTEDAPRSSGR